MISKQRSKPVRPTTPRRSSRSSLTKRKRATRISILTRTSKPLPFYQNRFTHSPGGHSPGLCCFRELRRPLGEPYFPYDPPESSRPLFHGCPVEAHRHRGLSRPGGSG